MVVVFDDVIAARSCAEGRGLARGGAPAGARDQEPAHADSTVRRAAPPPLLAGAASRRVRSSTSARRRSSARSSRSRGWWTSSRSLRACRRREPCPPTCTRCSTTRWRSIVGCFTEVEIRTHFAESLPKVSIDRGTDSPRHHQSRGQRDRGDGSPRRHRHRDSRTTRRTAWCASSSPTTAPAFQPAEREKLFLPYYSTKQRGSGLGLAIVRRIVAEHGGSIDVTDNPPRGTRFAIELPC